MNERKPICLYGALAIPAAWVLFLILAFIMNTFSSSDLNSLEYNNLGTAVAIYLSAMGISVFLFLLLFIISLVRKEKFIFSKSY